MTKFEEELKKNILVCSFCMACDKFVWPPSNFCNSCFANVAWKKVERKAKLVEFSRINDEIFCIAEFEGNIRLMGNIQNSQDLIIGQSLILVKCDYDGDGEKFILEPIL